MRILVLGDVHYDLRKLDWLLGEASAYEVVVVVGDLLDVASVVPLEAQIPVIMRYLERLAARTRLAVCSGNHDLSGPDAHGEQAAGWLAAADAFGAVVDGGTLRLGDTEIDVCPWWDGPVGRQDLEDRLSARAEERTRDGVDGSWIWAYHWPPPDLPVSWIGSRYYGDADLAGWIDRFGPDLVLSGHVHQSPWTDGGSWIAATGRTWVVNAGRQRGPEPSHITIDLDRRSASWVSYEGSDERSLALPEPVIGAQ